VHARAEFLENQRLVATGDEKNGDESLSHTRVHVRKDVGPRQPPTTPNARRASPEQ
jgi:hypothetical protein